MIIHEARSIVPCRNALGEACIWHDVDQSLWWTDIESREVLRLRKPGGLTRFSLPDRPAFVFPRTAGGFVIGFPGGLALTDDDFQSFQWLLDIEPAVTHSRVNDATVDPWGGIVLGTYNQRDRQPIGGVYRISPSGEVVRLLSNVAVANGLAFSSDGGIMYFADSAEGTIRRFAVGDHMRSFAELAPLAPRNIAPGAPDGAVVDNDGGYWSARLRGGCVVRINPGGEVTDRVDLAAMGPTCAVLGGQSRSTLYITTRRVRQPAEELARLPQSGDLFAVDVGFRSGPGLPCLV